MKLLTTFLSCAIAGDWPGQIWSAEDQTFSNCGSQTFLAENSVNKTCSISFGGYKPMHVSIPGCFTEGTGLSTVTCNGVEGVTNTDGFDVTVFWEQGFGLDGLLDNSTCGYEEDITMSCVDNGAEPSVALFDNIANNFHSSGSSQNFQVQIFGAAASSAYSMDMRDMQGEAATITNVTCGLCDTIEFDGSSVSITTNKDAEISQLFFVQIETAAQLSQHTSTIRATDNFSPPDTGYNA